MPFSTMERIPASRITSGVGKSGSPTPREITSCMVAAMSKNLRIPDGLMACTFWDNNSLTNAITSLPSVNIMRILQADYNSYRGK